MANVHTLLTYARKREVARELTRRGYRVSGETLNRWVRDHAEMDPAIEREILRIFGIPVDIEESAPAWAEALANETAKKVIEALAPAELVEAAQVTIARLEALQQLPADSSPAIDESPVRGGAARRPRGRG